MDEIRSALEWLRFAKMDLSSAEFLLKHKPLPKEIICFHCQQTAEKGLKGVLVLK
jgi:HEPN domain-containing protein